MTENLQNRGPDSIQSFSTKIGSLSSPKRHIRRKVDRRFSEAKCPQSASLLAEHYAEFADMRLLGTDPFYALNELFQFAANAESIFLATLETKIDADTGYTSFDE